MTTEPQRLWYPECDITIVSEDDDMRRGDREFFDRYVGKLYQQQCCPYCGSRVAQLSVPDGRYSEYGICSRFGQNRTLRTLNPF